MTFLGDTAGAWAAQQRALELCPDQDFTDRTLIRLDRTLCLTRDGGLGTLAILAFVAVGSLPLVIGAVMAGQWIVLLAGFGGAAAFTFVLTARR
ncbi:hypothetical protein [Actinomadura sp. 3N407]|uniref:hypothetical protein n=1 Tax=Actinomadura sp. 3N407 TaxID=3457423 RepID=UPI003FCDEA43